MRILVANRGEIARRVFRTAHRLGHSTVAVYAEPDTDAPFVADATLAMPIGPADLASSYLSIERILAAAVASEATAIHPGYGFLSENTAFAREVQAAGLIWIGPSPAAVEQMGSKIEARRLAAAAGVPIIPGFDRSQTAADLAAAAVDIGFPVLVKAAAGGGGKGIRIVHAAIEFDAALLEAKTEAERSFGNGDMIVERYVQRPRHVEVQVVGDQHGTVIDLGTRECSVQRRYQKLLEEAPAPNLPDATRSGLRRSAVELAASIGYDSAGTVEFIVDDETGDYFFLEMNTRLQVEHPVTEFVTGLDLVELQIRSAIGDPLPLGQGDIAVRGHSIEARINAEDPGNDFAPQIGTISHLRVPDGVRWDSGIEAGSAISPHYDAMVAKLIVGANDRDAALAKLRTALNELIVGGLTTNTGFHRWLIDQEPIVAGRVTTRFLDDHELQEFADFEGAARLAATVWRNESNSKAGPSPWSSLTDFTVTPYRPHRTAILEHHNGDVFECLPRTEDTDIVFSVSGNSVAVNMAGTTQTFRVVSRSERWRPQDAAGLGALRSVEAPFPSVVSDVLVGVGDVVESGQIVVVIEAMKMLHSLTANGPGTVDEVRVKAGDQVASNQILVTFAEEEGPS